MQRIMKKMSCLLLAFLLLAGLLPQLPGAFAEETVLSGTCGENITWRLDKTTGILTFTGSGKMTNYEYKNLPEWYSERTNITKIVVGEGITSLGSRAFCACDEKLTSVELPNGLERVGACCFDGCEALQEIYIPDSVTTIDNLAFAECTSLKKIHFPASLKKIEHQSFMSTGLEELTIPEGITEIKDMAFYGLKRLREIHLPASLETLGSAVFGAADALETITVAAGNPRYDTEDGVLFDRQEATLLNYPAANARVEYTVPDGVASIGKEAFEWSRQLKHVHLPDSIRVIGNGAFGASGVESINFPEGLESIEDYAFSSAAFLKDVTLPESLTYIGLYSFQACTSLTSLVLPEAITVLRNDVFRLCDSLAELYVTNASCILYGRDLISDKTVIIGHEDSTAHTYAKNYGKRFRSFETGKLTEYQFTNEDFLALLPTEEIHADGHVDASTRSIVSDTGFHGYDAVILKETNPENETYREIVETVNQLTANCQTDYEKAHEIQKWVSKNIKYVLGVVSGNRIQCVYGLWKNRRANCMGFTMMTNFMLWTEGIPSATVEFYGHECSAALVDGRWILIDSSAGGFDISPNNYSRIMRIFFASDNISYAAESKAGIWLTGVGNRYDGNTPSEPLPVPDFVKGVYTGHRFGDLDVGMIGSVHAYCHEFAKDYYPYVYYRGETFYAFKTRQTLTYSVVGQTDPTCEEAGYIEYQCVEYDGGFTNTIPALGHDWSEVIDTAPSCSSESTATLTCKRCGATKTETVPANSHTPAAPVEENRIEPTCTDVGSYDMVVYCAVCGAEISRETMATAALGHVLVLHRAKAPTCTEIGWKAYQTCARCDYTTYMEMPATGHTPGTPVGQNETAATCTETGGYDLVTYCSVCNAEISREHTDVAVLGHDWNEPEYVWAEDYSSVTAMRTCKNDGSHAEAETVNTTSEVTQEVTYEEEGEITYTATFENAAFAVQTKTVTTPKLEKQDDPKPTNPFVDVQEGAYYYDAVLWAGNHTPQITNGTSATTFSPTNTCTRAQVVTFLWRAKGCPEPTKTENPFTDVQAGAYYYKAVLWAVEKGITNGTSAITFGPSNGCTRAQVVTFLWRTEGQPEPQTTDNPFTDVTGGYYYKAILWVVEQEITNGISETTFGPNATCTRGQIVTFLYRDLG